MAAPLTLLTPANGGVGAKELTQCRIRAEARALCGKPSGRVLHDSLGRQTFNAIEIARTIVDSIRMRVPHHDQCVFYTMINACFTR